MLHFKKYGTGSKVMLAFHGFGGTHRDWEPFMPALDQEYTIYCFDLWHHGESNYSEKPLSKLDFENAMNQFFAANQIYKFSLLGYSLGGRMCLQLIETHPGKVENVFLFAPDGLHRNILYTMVTRTIIGNMLFKTIIDRPKVFFAGCAFLAKIGILHSKINSFIHQQLGTKANRERVYRSWRTTSRLWPDLAKTGEHLVRYKIAITIYMGNNDRLVRTHWAKALTRHMTENKDIVKVLEGSHNLQTERIRKLVWGV